MAGATDQGWRSTPIPISQSGQGKLETRRQKLETRNQKLEIGKENQDADLKVAATVETKKERKGWTHGISHDLAGGPE
jgi:hypothetical protein